MNRLQIGRIFVLLGTVWGIIVSLGISSQQLHLGSVLRGEMPFAVAAVGRDALPFLGLIVVVCLIALSLALAGQRVNLLYASVGWILAGIILSYSVYLSRFSVGILLLPSAFLIFLAGISTLWRELSHKPQ